MIDDQQPKDTCPLITEDINNIDSSTAQMEIVPSSSPQSFEQEQGDAQLSKYQVFFEFLIVELNKRYDLRPRSSPWRPSKCATIIELAIKSVQTQTPTPQTTKSSTTTFSSDKTILTTFNIEKELERVKIPIPLAELSKIPGYKNQVSKWIQSCSVDVEGDVISLQDEKPSVVFDPSSDMIDEIVPPFYVTLKAHDFLLYNYMLDYGASHNLMSKVIMDQLQLQVTRSYHDIYTFYSKKVPCLGLIKDIVVNLAQIPVKSIVLDIVVTNIRAKFGMLLFRSCCAKLEGSLQMDMSFATILVYGGDHLRLYREFRFLHAVCKSDQAKNHPIYALDHDFGCIQLSSQNSSNTQLAIENIVSKPKIIESDILKLYFDGSCSTEGAGAGIVLSSANKENIRV